MVQCPVPFITQIQWASRPGQARSTGPDPKQIAAGHATIAPRLALLSCEVLGEVAENYHPVDGHSEYIQPVG